MLAGHYRFDIGGEVIVAGPGDHVFIGRGVPHDFIVGTGAGRALFVFSPGGIEDYFRGLAAMDGAASSPVAIDELKRRHHIEPPNPS
ncbi:MAG: AraC family ligand binding domain-containing protein [Acidimicrobiia bacterium]|nr:AraC family ligand binding domain-containing protein [Acidimicrobiia bacterium]